MKRNRKHSRSAGQFTEQRLVSENVGNEEKYRMIFENSPLGIFRSTFEGRLLEVNAALAKMFGYDSPESMVREVYDVAKQMYVHPEDRAKIVADQMGTADVTNHLNHYRRKDGKEFLANLYLKTVRDVNGRPLFLEGIAEDITERKRMEERLRSLHQYALGLASAADLDEIVNHTLDTMQFNLGLDSAEFDLIEDGLLVVKGTRGKLGSELPRRLDDLGVMPKAARELRSIRLDDTRNESSYVDRMGPDWKGPPTMLSELATPVIIEDRAVAVLNVEDAELNAFSEQDQILLENLAAHVASEIKRKRVEDGLRRSKERYISLLDRMLDGVYLSTHQGRFVDVNPAFVKMFGYSSKKEMLDIPDIKKVLYFSPEERGSHILDSGKDEVEVYRMRRKDGSEIWVEDHGSYVHDKYGNVLYHEGILRDVTDRKRAEEKLRESEEALRRRVEELNSLHETLLEITGRHELSQLLNSIVERAAELLDAPGGGMYLCDPDKREVRCVVAYNTKVNSVGIVLKYGEGAAGVVAQTGKPLLIDDYRSWPTRAAAYEKEKPFGAVASAPMVWQGQVIGVIHVLRYDTRRFTEADLRLLVMLANHAAIAVENTRLLAQVENHAAELQRLVNERTERLRESEQESRAAKERLEYVVTSNPAIIYSATPLPDYSDWRLTYISERVTTMLGFEPREFIDQPEFWAKHVHPDDLHSVLAEVPRIFREGIGTMDYRFRHKDGTYRWIREGAKVIRDRDGKPSEVEGYWTDITELRKSEETLRESDVRYRRVFESSPISLWEEDFSEVKIYFDGLRNKGIQDVRRYFAKHPDELDKCARMVKVVDVNKATLDLYGAKSVKELRGELRRVFTREFQDNFREELVALCEGKTRFESEFENQTLTGGTKHVSLMLNVVPGYENTLSKVLVSIIDLTERKEMEERLKQAERLAAVGETAAMVGHDLRNPLQGIAGAVHLLKQGSLTAKEREEMLEVIEKSLRYADAIIRDLSDYAAEFKLRLAETTPKSITSDAIVAVKVPRNVIVRDLSADEPALRVDPDKMRRVLINLIQNAIDAMPQGGTLTIRSKRSYSGIEIAISDSGSGMPEEAMGNLFKPLHTTKAKGLGLGLAICKRIVEAHGGDISVRSKAGEGTTVGIRLPIHLSTVEVTQK